MVPSSYHVDPLATTRVREVMSAAGPPGLDEVAPGPTIGPEATLRTALSRMLDGAVERMPVVDGEDEVVGVLTVSDVLQARARQLDLERTERGWLASTRIPRRRTAREAVTAPGGAGPR